VAVQSTAACRRGCHGETLRGGHPRQRHAGSGGQVVLRELLRNSAPTSYSSTLRMIAGQAYSRWQLLASLREHAGSCGEQATDSDYPRK
jgi:hypothetical protein